MDEKAQRLLSSAYTLKTIHKGTAKLQHAIRVEGEEWQEYYPNYFIFAFFCFNSLYNVDWEESYRRGRVTPVSMVPFTKDGKTVMREQTEGEKQFQYLKFCFKKDFTRVYKDFFIRFVLRENTVEEIDQILSSIQPDRLPNGSVWSQDFITNFQNAVHDLLRWGKFDKDTVSTIVKFIYSVRCNIFHGVKTIDDMKDLGQQDRLDVYASLIIALNQMVFSCLEFLDKGEGIKDTFDDLYDSLLC